MGLLLSSHCIGRGMATLYSVLVFQRHFSNPQPWKLDMFVFRAEDTIGLVQSGEFLSLGEISGMLHLLGKIPAP